MNEHSVQQAVAALVTVRRAQRLLDAYPAGAEPGTIASAYDVQDALVEALGETPSGWKVGCTSKMAQEMSGTDEPFYGRMFPASSHASPATVDAAAVFAPIVEPEIAFRLGVDIAPRDRPYEVREIVERIDGMFPAIEIVDCRYASGWPIDIVPTIADNGVHAVFIAGAEVDRWREVDRPAIPVRVEVNGDEVVDGVGANALDDPINALVWLANRCTARGCTLAAGEVVTTGNTARKPVFAKPGDEVLASFGALGEVRLQLR